MITIKLTQDDLKRSWYQNDNQFSFKLSEFPQFNNVTGLRLNRQLKRFKLIKTNRINGIWLGFMNFKFKSIDTDTTQEDTYSWNFVSEDNPKIKLLIINN